MAMTRKRFHLQDDFVLLREVIKHNPFEDPDRWMNVVHTLRKETLKAFTVRGARERMELLLSQWSDTDSKERLKRSATQEQYVEKDKLLQQVFDMEQQVYPKPRRLLYPRSRLKKRNVDAQTEVLPRGANENSNGVVCHIVSYPDTYPVAEADRNDSAPTEFIEGYSLAGADPSMSSGDDDPMEHDNGGTKRKREDGRQEFLERQVDREQTIKEKELQLEERRLKLDEERLAFERTKYEAEMAIKVRKLDMEEEERKIRNDTDRMHLELMKKMFDELVRKVQ